MKFPYIQAAVTLQKGIYYYKTYDNSRIAGIDMHKEDFDGTKCVCYKPDKTDIFIQN